MGYSDFGNFKLLDGYAFSSGNNIPFYTNWVDVHSSPHFDVSVVFTGGTVTGTLTLQKSNDLQWTGGNRPTTLYSALGQTASGKAPVSDVANAATGQGTVAATVTAPGVYSLNQYNVGYRWFRVEFLPTDNSSTTLDIFVNWKKA